jgi:hypothetical protein
MRCGFVLRAGTAAVSDWELILAGGMFIPARIPTPACFSALIPPEKVR